jgi:hypothetical protein
MPTTGIPVSIRVCYKVLWISLHCVGRDLLSVLLDCTASILETLNFPVTYDRFLILDWSSSEDLRFVQIVKDT